MAWSKNWSGRPLHKRSGETSLWAQRGRRSCRCGRGRLAPRAAVWVEADVWAMGIIMYELITFKKPFDSDKLNSLFDLIIAIHME